jgi:Lrp/AsnC family transcriptional regulator, leucine-responsive regulatory protein
MKLDQTERVILRLLQQNGRLSNAALAEHVGLSESPCYRRVRQLEQAGVITGYAAVVDQRRLGLDVTAFVLVTMEKQPDAATEAFLAAVQAEEHIVECYATSGSHDYLMKVVARSIDHFSELCMQRILKFPGVMHVESSFSLKEVKHSRVLPA